MVWTQEGIRTFSQRFFTKVFTRLLEEQKSLKQIYLEASDGNSTKFEELVTSLADAAFEEFVDVKINHIEKGIRGTQIPAESESGETPNPNSLEKPQGTSTN